MGIAQVLAENERLRRQLVELATEQAAHQATIAARDAVIAARDADLVSRNAEIALLKESNEALARTLELIRLKAMQRHERYVEVDAPLLPFSAMKSPEPKPPVPAKPDEAKPEPISKKPEKKPRGVQRRRDVSEMNELPTRTMIAQVSPESDCDRCGGALKVFGQTETWRIDWVQGHFERLRVLREKCACPACPSEGVLVAPEPSFALPKALCGNRLLARVLTDKFADGLPLNRQAKRMEREGFEVGTATLSGWVLGAASLLGRVVDAIDVRLKRSTWLQGDDTGFPVQDGTDGQLRRGRLWCYTDQQEVRYVFSDTKEGKNPVAFLDGFAGQALLVDLGSEFNEVVRAKGLERAACRVGGGVTAPTPHRPGRADFPHPVPHGTGSLLAA